MEVVFLSGAELDLDEIYSRLGESGGEKFLGTLDRKLELLRGFPLMAPRAQLDRVRKATIGRTPYGIFYSIEGSRLMVIAVQDLRQDVQTLAKIIRSRL